MTVATEELGTTLAKHVREVIARSDRITRRSRIVVEASRCPRDAERLVAHCAWCGKVRVGEGWLAAEELPFFLAEGVESRRTHSICPDCYEDVQQQAGDDRPVPRTQVLIRAGDPIAAECLTRSLREYPVVECAPFVLQVTLPDASTNAVTAVLSRVAGCLASYQLPAVTIDLADRSYTLDGELVAHD